MKTTSDQTAKDSTTHPLVVITNTSTSDHRLDPNGDHKLQLSTSGMSSSLSSVDPSYLTTSPEDVEENDKVSDGADESEVEKSFHMTTKPKMKLLQAVAATDEQGHDTEDSLSKKPHRGATAISTDYDEKNEADDENSSGKKIQIASMWAAGPLPKGYGLGTETLFFLFVV
jgi:hypothetical protein